MGVVDLGRGILFRNMLSEAAREGARTGIVSTNTISSMCSEAINRVLAPGVGSSTGCGSISDGAPTTFGTLTVTVHQPAPGSTDSCTLSYTFTPITPLIDQALKLTGTSIQLTASAKMFVEN
jgi:hypothetical protein